MPTADLDAFRELLPWWVKAGAWFAMPLLMAVVAAVLMWLTARLLRPKLDDLHWTEAARQHFTYMRMLGLNTLWYAALAGTFTYMEVSGPLVPFDRLTHAILVGLSIWAIAIPIKIGAARSVFPGMRFRDFISGILFLWVIFYPVIVIVLAMATLAPPNYADHTLRFWFVYGFGALMTWWMIRGGHLPLARLLGILRPADERAQRVVDDAARLSGHTPERIWIARTAMANAAAIPASNQVLVTSRALDAMTHEELVSLMLHEFGHLKEKPASQLKRLVGLTFLFTLGMWRPLIDWLTVYGFVGLLVASFVLSLYALRGVRSLESEADEHAHEHGSEDDPGLYARTLEKLSRLNMIPVVMQGKGQTHPHMYDRMVAAGVTPEYPRPEPPPKSVGKFAGLGVLAVAVFVCEAVFYESIEGAAYRSEDDAMMALMVSGGGVRASGALGYHWQTTQQDKAVVALRVAAANSDWVEYPARLAWILAPNEPDEARALLDRAAERYREMDRVHDWLRDLVDETREQLGLPPEKWPE